MKNRWLLYSFLALLLLAIGLVYFMDPWSTTGSRFDEILPEEPERISRITVIGDYDTLVFTKNDSTWLMGGEEMNKDAVENLLYAAHGLKMKSILAPAELQKKNQVLEMIFEHGRREAGHFLLGSSPSGYFVVSPGEDQGYGVELPGYADLPLEKVFSPNADHYRQHLLVDLLPAEIRSVTVQPWKGRAFIAEQDSLYDIMVVVPGENRNVTDSVSEHRIRLLFSYFNAIRYTRLAEPGELNGALSGTPFSSVEVTTFQGNRINIEVFQWIPPGAPEPDLFEAIVLYNGKPQPLVVNYYYLDLLMRGLEHYY